MWRKIRPLRRSPRPPSSANESVQVLAFRTTESAPGMRRSSKLASVIGGALQPCRRVGDLVQQFSPNRLPEFRDVADAKAPGTRRVPS
jgi:hypothetical protein